MRDFLCTSKTNIVFKGKKIILKGVNLGAWLMMEGYMLHSLNIPEQTFKKDFKRDLGEKALEEFETAFRDNFIKENDFKKIAALGFNCVRVPFNYRLIEKAPYQHDARGVKYLDDVIRWGKKHHVWIILDLHGACGAQNHDWHSDSLGSAELWTNKECQQRTFALWGFLADRYKDEPAVAGYDILNEAVMDKPPLLNAFYKQVIKVIRGVDSNHIIFVEGNNWARDIDCLDDFIDDNLALSIHFYEPLDFTFNLVPHLSYPLKSAQGTYNKKTIHKMMRQYYQTTKKRAVPILVGEFGINDREGFYGEDRWLKDVLDCFDACGFHWTYWSYKTVKNGTLPDGLFVYKGNPPWVNRLGPRLGWDNFSRCWPTRKKEMIKSWRTEEFEPSKALLKVVKKAIG